VDLSTIATFVVAVFLISASPGPAVALILRRAALRGFRSAVATVLGLELGLYLWALAAAAGFAALVAASEAGYLALRVVGAGVLLYLGLRSLRSAWRERRLRVDDEVEPVSAAAPGRREWWRAFGEGVVVQLANPKAAVFMLAFYPQFVPADEPLFLTTAWLALLQVALETGLYLGLAAGVARAGRWFSRPSVRRRLETVTGTVLVSLGARMAFVTRGA
jgi:threonine/homoserine/homoserine lactone efflux protein